VFFKLDTGSLSRGATEPDRGVEHPPESRAEVKERVELRLYSKSATALHVMGRSLLFQILGSVQAVHGVTSVKFSLLSVGLFGNF
jgi:hypothetical protein